MTRPFPSLLFVLLPLGLLSSCAQFFVKEKTYLPTGSATVNGAEVASAVKGMGGKSGLSVSAMVYSAASGETDGPFLWRIEARGEEGVHESLTVHRLRVKTEKTGRNEPFPAKWLGTAAPFEPLKGKKNEGTTFAKFQLPGKLEVFPESDGRITLEADLTVRAGGRNERRQLTFVMEPSVGRKTENLFLPGEIIGSLGKEDPTEWQWNSAGSDRYGDRFWGDSRNFH
ncbi:hypothetical protein [Roseibacillus ishigakijimensis]|uniref:Lipoprotein n=1 Tax=Roseibacillus ishigakijimensis TaxID=454146 RepID=A0A934VLX4_9BACT|nr:hypothetical protein [Roseibacillus ishigakijimensis]MBK1835144.1 hypothetical protein [Roseibacillus ishigakijimensis]